MIDLTIGGKVPLGASGRQALLEAGQAAGTNTERHARLERLEAFYRGLEYSHQLIGWDGFAADPYESISPQAPASANANSALSKSCRAREKRPTAPTRLAPFIVDRFTGLLFGLGRTPEVTVEDDPQADDFLREALKRFGFWRAMVSARTFGGSMGSALILATLDRGRFTYEAINPRHVAEIAWADSKARVPSGVLIQFAFSKEVDGLDQDGHSTGKREVVDYLYRRIIDEHMDLHFEPTPIDPTHGTMELKIDATRTRMHGLGHFPGAWVQNLPDDEDLDGIPDCDGTYQSIEEIDRQLAQQGRSLLANMDPTLVLSSDPKLAARGGAPLRKGSDNAIDVGPGGTASYLEISGAGVTASAAFVKDLRRNVLDRAQCVAVDPADIAGAAQSAKAIELIYAPMLEKAGRLREQYGAAIERMAAVTLGLARRWADPMLYGSPRRVAVAFDLPPLIVQEASGVRTEVARAPGRGTMVSLRWGPYFQATPSDIQREIAIVAQLRAAGLMDLDTAVEHVAGLLKIKDVAGLLARVKAEAEAKAAASALGGGMPGYGPPGGFG